MEEKRVGFVHLHVHTEYSPLDGHSRIQTLVEKAKELGHPALAITDHGAMHGVVKFYNACMAAGIKPILGVELYTAPTTIFEKTRESGHIILLAKDNKGYQNITKLSSIAATDGMYYRPRVDMALLRKHREGVICLSACLQGDVPQLLLKGEKDRAYQLAKEYRDIFGPDYYIELQYHGLDEQRDVLPKLVALAKDLDIPMVATNDVHYVERKDAFAQRVLMCMSMGKTVDDKEAVGYGAPDHFYFKTEEEMVEIFGAIAPEAIENTMAIADKCNVQLAMETYHLPTFPLPDGWDSTEAYFNALCRAGLRKRYGRSADEHRPRLEMEMGVIKKMGFIDYFLIVFDIVAWAKRNGIAIGPGRGSAAGSIVSYCLGITDLDPTRYGLLFERFLNPERVTMPDIDIDVDPEGRDMVLDHIIEMYGSDHVAQIITFGTLAAKSAVLDVGKALGLVPDVINRVNKAIPLGAGVTIRGTLESNRTLEKNYREDADVRRLLDVAMSVEGLIRHTSTHAAGVVISPAPLTDYIPVTRGKDGTTILVSQFDMGSVEQVGMLKVDLLGLKTLTVLKHAEAAVRDGQSPEEQPMSLSGLKMEDRDVYAMMSRGETGGVFQFESEGMRDVLRKMQPSCFEDIVAAIALYRPGPMDSIPTFIQNKHHPENVQYLHPLLEPILKDTYGCIVYQEQVMAIVRKLAGYSYARADLVRRAMSKKKAAQMDQEREIFINGKIGKDGAVEVDGALRRGIPLDVAEKLWDMMAAFAAYAFNKSHAACYAVLAYRTAFMRCHYPREFMAALLTSALGDSKKMLKLLSDCEKQGIQVLPPDINASGISFTVEGRGVRFGLLAVKNTGRAVLAELTMEREKSGRFTDLQNLVERTLTSANKRTLEALIKSGALDSFPHSRAEMLAVLPTMIKSAAKARKTISEAQMSIEDTFFSGLEDLPAFSFPTVEYPANIPPLTARQKLDMEMEACGMYVSGHPMAEYEDTVAQKVTHRLHELSPTEEDGSTPQPINSGQQVRVAGVVRTKKIITTKKKSSMAFLTIEDQSGKAEITVFPKAYEAYSGQLMEGTAILVYGKAEVSEWGVKVITDSIAFLDDMGKRTDQAGA